MDNQEITTTIKGNERKFNRRDFLKIAGGFTAGLVFNSLLGEYIKKKNPELEKYNGVLSEYSIGWRARPWVWVNLAIAARKLDGMEIHPGEEVSIVKKLELDKSIVTPEENRDPNVGYVSAQMSDWEKLSGIGYGLCLGSTAIFRAALNSPVEIIEHGTHYDLYPEYFNDMPEGTDAAVYYPGKNDPLPITDLKIRNPTDKNITLRFGIYDINGKQIFPPEKEIPLVTYKASFIDHVVSVLRNKVNRLTGTEMPEQYLPQYAFGNRKIIVRAAFCCKEELDYQVSMGDQLPIEEIKVGTKNYRFGRDLKLNLKGGFRSIKEIFVSQYGKSPVQINSQSTGD